MIDIKLIRENPDIVRKDLKKRKDTVRAKWVDEILKLDEEWRKLKKEIDELRAERNSVSKKIAEAKKAGKDPKKVLEEAKKIPEKIAKKEEKANELLTQINQYLMRLPNIMHESVPYGKDESENVEVRKWGKVPKFKFEVRNHAEIAEELGVADFDRARKIAGNGFYFLKGDLALLNQALIRFAIDHMVSKGFVFVEPPYMINKATVDGVTDYETFQQSVYSVKDEDLHLIATSEHPLMGQFMNESIPAEQTPLKMVGYSACFRKEIGSHGIDEKGFFRVHQFHKVEQVVICKPEESWEMHEEILKNTEELFQALKLPYRIVNICTGDLGVVAAKKYDLEVWMPRQEKYREAASCSNCTDYQTRRLGIKYGVPGGKGNPLAHSLNNTAIATSRALVAILENYQEADGSVIIPEALRGYMGGRDKIKKK